jgi:hypothetical protein
MAKFTRARHTLEFNQDPVQLGRVKAQPQDPLSSGAPFDFLVHIKSENFTRV